MANLFAAYQSLPESIQKWLSDENVILMIDEINQKLNLSIEDETAEIIPNLILRLCVQDLSPRDFINELSHYLDISFESAKTLTKEIEEKILKPIEAPLKIDVGVDLKLLYFANPALRSWSSTEQASQEQPPQDKPVELPKPSNSTSAVESLGKPFILHQENVATPQTPQSAQPSFSYKVPINQTPAQPAPPPKAQIEVPKPTIQRVVHYSGFFTKLFLEKENKSKESNVPLPKSRWFI